MGTESGEESFSVIKTVKFKQESRKSLWLKVETFCMCSVLSKNGLFRESSKETKVHKIS